MFLEHKDLYVRILDHMWMTFGPYVGYIWTKSGPYLDLDPLIDS